MNAKSTKFLRRAFLTMALFIVGGNAVYAQNTIPFVTTWEVAAGGLGITIPTNPNSDFAYRYTVDWGDNSADTRVYTGDATHTYTTAGIYTVSIAGTFPSIYFNAPNSKFNADERKIKTIKQWGDNPWKSMNSAFAGCPNLTMEATAGNPDLSNVTNMSSMFNGASTFNQDIGGWDVSNVTNMRGMFVAADAFNQDLNRWDVSNVTDMRQMFIAADAFNGDISGWDVSKVTDMSWMFHRAYAFNQDLNRWDVSNVTDMSWMFTHAVTFNGDISGWDVSKVTDMSEMFYHAEAFNQDLNRWDVSSVVDMSRMFESAVTFNGNISGWDVSSVVNMHMMFRHNVTFNGNISGWDVSSVTDMSWMFDYTTAFNQDLNRWDVSNVTNMRGMFYHAEAFNQDINRWDVSKVTDMSWMFDRAYAFNQDLNRWDVSNVTDMSWMFTHAVTFNGNISGWDVSKVTDMEDMFRGAVAFNRDLSGWDVSKVTDMDDMFSGVTLSIANYDALLSGWSALPTLQRGFEFGGGYSKYCNESARNILVNTYNWRITDGGKDTDENCLIDQAVFAFASTSLTKSTGDAAFTITPTGGSGTGGITYLSTDPGVASIAADSGEVTIAAGGTTTITATKAGDTTYNPATASYTLTIDIAIDYSNAFVTTWEVAAGGLGITIPTNGDFAYSYTVDWGDNSADTRVYTGDAAHTYTTAGIYTVSISGTFPSIYFSAATVFDFTNSRKILTIKQWGDNPWKSMNRAFQGCQNLIIEAAAGTPDLSNVTDMSEMFYRATTVNQGLSGWDVSNVTDMSSMFVNADAFNQDLNRWDVSKVTDMYAMFAGATAFNGDISGWDVSKVTNMSSMFDSATAFNRDISGWDVSNVADMWGMFNEVTLSTANYDALLRGWSVLPSLIRDVFFDGGNSNYCDESARSILVNTYNWGITDGGKDLENCLIDQEVFAFASTSITKSTGDAAFTITPTGGSGTGGITYLSTDPGVASIAADSGEVTIAAGGTTTITATKAGDTTYNPATASYTLTIDIAIDYSNAFVTTWEVAAGGLGITIPTNGDFAYRYTVDWGDNSADTRVYTGDAAHTYTTAGIYTVSISGTFPSIYFAVSSFGSYDDSRAINGRKIKTIKQWGDNPWKSMNSAFRGCENLTIEATAGNPDLSNVTDMYKMFYRATIVNQGLSGWDVSNVTDMSQMFYHADAFNQDLNRWDVSSVVDMFRMFESAVNFNGDISGWDVSNVTDMDRMFLSADAFNQDLNRWDVSSVVDMSRMFDRNDTFNGNISGWDVSKVTDMGLMFGRATAFNQDLSKWDVSKVTDMRMMFDSATAFNRDLSGWDVSKVTDMDDMFSGVTLSIANYDALLSGWSALPTLQRGFEFGGGYSKYCNESARNILVNTYNWRITDGGKDTDENCLIDQAVFAFASTSITKSTGDAAFTITPTGGSGTGGITYLSTDPGVASIAADSGEVTIAAGGTTTITATKAGDTTYNPATASYTLTIDIAIDYSNAFVTTWEVAAGSLGITIPTNGDFAYRYTVDWGDNSADTRVYTGDATHTYSRSGIYTVSISGTFPSIYFSAATVFDFTNSRKILTIKQWGDNPWKSMNRAFQGCQNLIIEAAAGTPDLSNVTDMSEMFYRATTVNQGLSGWDVSNVTDMSSMFVNADAFNQDLNRWDVSKVTDMYAMFAGATAFNGDISGWDVSKVTNMSSMFDSATAFNRDISGWDVSKVTDMSAMFSSATAFNQNISRWDVSKVTDMQVMFNHAFAFNQNISRWDVSKVTDMQLMFNNAIAFNQDISGWNVGKVTNMRDMFSHATAFNRDLSKWDVSKVTNMRMMFNSATDFNQNISRWDVSKVTDMQLMFNNAIAFNQDISGWNVGKVTDMQWMFSHVTAFNWDLSKWDVSKVTDMYAMFNGATAFNRDLSKWDVSKVTNMRSMFHGATAFNQNISGWNVGKVTNMYAMFSYATAFNQNISRWDVSKVTDMQFMFNNAIAFNQNISRWDVSKVTNMWAMFNEVTLSTANYDALLIGWSALPSLKNDVPFGGGNSNYCDESARSILVNTYNWGITDGGKDTDENCLIDQAVFAFASTSITKSTGDAAFTITPTGGSGTGGITYLSTDPGVASIAADSGEVTIAGVGTTTITATKAGDTTYNPATASYTLTIDIDYSNAFVTTWEVAAGSLGITIPTNSDFDYRYTVDWGDNSADIRVYTGDAAHTYTTAGIYTVSIAGTFPSIYFDAIYSADFTNSRKIKTIKQWGDNPWKSMNSAFQGCQNLIIEAAAGNPDLSSVTDMSWMFYGVTTVNQGLIGWDVSKVTNMRSMFNSATAFNQNISRWDVSKVTNMRSMFNSATAFNQNISRWDVSKVTDMWSMFNNAIAFNQDINRWDVSKVTDMSGMFAGAAAFNRDISGWNVGKVTNMWAMFNEVTLSTANYDALLIGWSALPSLKNDVPFGGGNSNYCDESARSILVNTHNWGITDGGKDTDENCLIDQAVFAFASTSLTKSTGDAAFTITPTGGSGTGGITYLSTDPGVASIAADSGEVTIAGVGTTTITATKAGDTTYNPATASYTLTIDNAIDYSNAFVTTWEVAAGGLGITIPTNRDFAYSYTVDWGDSSADTRVYTGDAAHTYTTAGIYTVSIAGTFPSIYFAVSSFGGYDSRAINGRKIKTIKQWGDNPWKSMKLAFTGCENLTIEATAGNPDLSNVTDMYKMFYRATIVNQGLSGWDVSNVTDMSQMFYHADAFNQDLNRWDVSSVVDMFRMFESAVNFNGDISGWDVSKVTDMERMFLSATAFNQDLNRWDVSSVVDMSRMFDRNVTFNGNISGWDVSKVTDMQLMFGRATAFNQDLSEWDVSKVTDMDDMFSGVTLSIANYDALLIGWSALPTLQRDVEFGGGYSKYCNESARNILVNTYNWGITDGGKGTDENCLIDQAVFAFASTSLTKSTGDAAFTITPTGGSGTGGITYLSTDPGVASIAADTGEVTIAGVGTTTITATKAGDTTYNPATASYTLTIDIAIDYSNAFVTTWEVPAGSLGITIPTNPNSDFDYSYTVDWGDNSADTSIYTGDAAHTYTTAGIYTVSIAGTFPSIYFSEPPPAPYLSLSTTNSRKIKTIKQWGDNPWKSMNSAFAGCTNLTMEATAGNPDLSNVTDMSYMFSEAAAFNQNISKWDVSKVMNMHAMFNRAYTFNQNLNRWDVGKVTNMRAMFAGTVAFNRVLSGWDVSKVTNMSYMFFGARAFNQNLRRWDVLKVTNMKAMFHGAAAFNQVISGWDVSKVTNMSYMFFGATAFNQDISGWNVGNVTNMGNMFDGVTLSMANYDALLREWSALPALQRDVEFGGGYSKYCNESARNILVNTYNWGITDGGKGTDENCLIDQAVFAFASTRLTKSTGDAAFTITPTGGSGGGGITYLSTDPGVASIAADSGEVTIAAGGTTTITATKAGDTTYNPATASYTLTIDIAIDYSNAFVTTWEVAAGSLGITIPTNGDFAYSYTVDWGDDSSADTSIYTGDATHTYTTAGIYTVSIAGTFPSIYFNAPSLFDPDKRKIKTIKQWGDNPWKSMNSAFYGCRNLTIEATAGTPDLSNVTDMSWMFHGATAFNQSLIRWDVSNVTNMSSMFLSATAFNQDINGWDVSKVTNMSWMFAFTDAFNRDLNKWEVSKVTNMQGMFDSATAFNRDINGWDVSQVTDMSSMFYRATAFNQALNEWKVGSVTSMYRMFRSAVAFNRDLSGWDVGNVTNMDNMFDGVTLSIANYDALLRGWSALTLQSGVEFGGGDSTYCDESARNILVNTYNWGITDGGKGTDENCLIDQEVFAFASTSITKSIEDSAFSITPTGGSGTGGITYLSTDPGVATIVATTGEVTIAGGGTTTITATKAGDTTYNPTTASYTLTINIDYSNAFITTWEVAAGSLGITIPTNGDFDYRYTVDWGDNSAATRIYMGDATHTYTTPGIYTVSIAGTFPSIYFNAPSLFDPDKRKIKTIKQWGDNPWKSMNSAFYGCRNLTIEETAGTPDLSNVTDMSWMFHGATAFNQSLIRWDVSNVTNMSSMFLSATAFNQDINGWDVSKVTNMSWMFAFTDAFNRDLNKWEVGKVTNMQSMFDSATAFNRDINGWDVSQVTDMSSMFYRATAFNQALNKWEVGSVTSMYRMFRSAAAFNRDLSGWDVSNVADMDDMFSGVTLSIDNYDALLRGWSALPTLKSDVPFNGGNSNYCDESARNILVNTYKWSILDGGKNKEVNCVKNQAVFAFASATLTKSFGDAAFTFTPTGGSGSGGITYQSTDLSVATIAVNSGKVTIISGGTTTITATKAGDTNYNEATASYTLTVLGLTLTPSTLALNEGTTITYTAMLDTQPTSTVTVTITSDNTEVTPAPATLTFTTANWNSAQSVTITAAVDTNLDDNIATLTHTASNGGYAGVTANLSVTATDIDTPPTFADGADIPSQTYPVGTPITTLILPEASGGVSTLTYALNPKTSIPDGLIFDASTRTLSGTPTTSSLATTLAYTVTDSATPTPHTVTLAFTVTVVQVEVYNGGEVSYSSGAIATTDVGGDENNDMRLMLPTDHTVTRVMVGVGTHSPTPSNPLPNGATYRGVGVDIELNSDLDEDTTATVCLSTAGASEGQATIYHWTGNPAAWEEIGIDTSTQPGFVCGKTATFSPFAVGFKTPNDTTRLNEQILTRAASAMTASTLAAVAARVESATDGGSGKPLAFQLDGQSSLRGLLEKNGKAMLEEQMDYQRLLDGASFVLPLSATDNASAGNTGKTAVWGSSGFRDLAADDANGIDWDGKTLSAHLGMDKRLSEQTLAGLALSWNDASFEYEDGDDSGEYQYSIVNIHPYFGWSNAGLKLWGTAGYGQGEITIDEEFSTDTTQLSLAGGFNHRLTGSPGRGLQIKGDIALTKVAVEAEADEFDEQEVENSRVRLLLSGERRRELASGGALTPSLEIGVRSDGGSGGTTGTGVELGGGLRYANGGKVAVVGNVRTLLAGEYDELGADFSVQLSSQSGRGLSLTLHPTWGRTQSASDTLWNDGASDITDGDTALRGSVDTEVGYGMAATMLGSPGLLTPYTGITAQDGGTSRLRLGGRFAGSNGLRLDLEGAQKNTADDVSHTVLLRGEVSF